MKQYEVVEGVTEEASLDKNWVATLICLNIFVNNQSYACL